jgi:hypothetical protein
MFLFGYINDISIMDVENEVNLPFRNILHYTDFFNVINNFRYMFSLFDFYKGWNDFFYELSNDEMKNQIQTLRKTYSNTNIYIKNVQFLHISNEKQGGHYIYHPQMSQIMC